MEVLGSMVVDGVLVIDKPVGPTSHDIVMKIKKKLSAKKVGHLGTLDPIASGVLPLVINRATKYAETLQQGVKEYDTLLKLGVVTDTYDAEGRVVEEHPIEGITEEDIIKVIEGFRGRLKQLPPMYSAVKVGGVPLYRLARKGIVVEREPKEVEIYSIKVVKVELPFVRFLVECSRGTYMRTLCHDIGQRLGCGGHLYGLTRTRSGLFTIEQAVSPELSAEELAAHIIPLEKVLEDVGSSRKVQGF